MVVITNGEDTSGLSFPTGFKDLTGQGYWVVDYTSSAATSSFAYYKNYIDSVLKAGPGLAKFYSVTAGGTATSTFGGQVTCSGVPSSFYGKRYVDMSAALNSASYDLCSGGLTNVLSSIGSQLQSMIQAFIFSYAVINEAPIVSTITVKKNGQNIPQSAVDGWTYYGYAANKYTALSPQPSNKQTGYFIQLNGSAKYNGNDVITIDYQKQ